MESEHPHPQQELEELEQPHESQSLEEELEQPHESQEEEELSEQAQSMAPQPP